MAPTEGERLAALENERGHNAEKFKEILHKLDVLPDRIGAQTRKQIMACRASLRRKKVVASQSSVIPQPESDFGWVKKIILMLFGIGAILGSAAHQFTTVGAEPAPALIQQQGDK